MQRKLPSKKFIKGQFAPEKISCAKASEMMTKFAIKYEKIWQWQLNMQEKLHTQVSSDTKKEGE